MYILTNGVFFFWVSSSRICISIHNYHDEQDKRLNIINIAQYFPSTWPYNLSRNINNACSSCLLPCGQSISSNLTLIYRYGNIEVIWPLKSGSVMMDICNVKGFIINRAFELQAEVHSLMRNWSQDIATCLFLFLWNMFVFYSIFDLAYLENILKAPLNKKVERYT